MNGHVLRRVLASSVVAAAMAFGAVGTAQATPPPTPVQRVVAVATATPATKVVAPHITKALKLPHLSAGQKATITVSTTGTALRYQWQVQQPGSKTWKNIGGGTKSTHRFTSTTTMNGDYLRVVVSNTRGKVTSAAARLIVDSTRKDPIKAGIGVNLTAWWVTVRATNSDGWPAIKAVNAYNTPPAAGTSYLIGTAVIRNLKTTGNPAYDLDVAYVGGNGRTYSETFVVYKDQIFDVNTMYHGASATFYPVVQVPSAAVSGGRWIVTDDSTYPRTQAWFNR